MKRAAIIVGVRKSGALPELSDAVPAARKVEEWARQQGMTEDCVRVITDERAPVRLDAIKTEVGKLVEKGTIEQLIVYFSGHGVNNSQNEYWLLSDAPVDTQAAVNVSGSDLLARRCPIPHVVFFSDACRTAAEGVQAQSIKGGEIFPNLQSRGVSQFVDLFFATLLGDPALEVKDLRDSAGIFEAQYTKALIEAVSGKHPTLLEPASENGKIINYVRPRPLRTFLHDELLRRQIARKPPPHFIQEPDAIIPSDPAFWIARMGDPLPPAAAQASPSGTEPLPTTLRGFSAELLTSALTGDRADLDARLAAGPLRGVEASARLLGAAAATRSSFGPQRFETHCGFKIRGARLQRVYSDNAQTWIIDPEQQVVRVEIGERPMANVHLILLGGTSVLLPAVKEFIAALTFDDGALVDVTYEPSENSYRWGEYASYVEEIRALRSIVASSARLGVFRLEGDSSLLLAQRMQWSKGIDPSFSIYAAYAYHQLNQSNRLKDMSTYQLLDLHATFYDLALLSGTLGDRLDDKVPTVFPFVPLLSQGWALLRAFGAHPKGVLKTLDDHLMRSLWTQFDREGTAILEQHMRKEALIDA